jgi:Ca2+-binding RTX toxin-like protein
VRYIALAEAIVIFALMSLAMLTSFTQLHMTEALFDIFSSEVHVSSSDENVINCVIPLCIGTNNDDIIIGSFLNETILGLNGNDNIQGNGGRDIIFGGKGDDIISGGTGFDKLFGDDGNDVIIGDSTTSLAETLVGNEVAEVDRFNEILLGANDTVSSSASVSQSINSSRNTADIFASQVDVNVLLSMNIQLLDGGKGDDRLLGQNGNEFYIGGPGHDYFNCNEGIDTVLDFNPQEDTADSNCEILQ